MFHVRCEHFIDGKDDASGSIRRAASSEPFGWGILGNNIKFRGVGRLAQDDVPETPANDSGASKPMRRRKGDNARDANIGAALRSVYSQAVDEPVPDEFMDLLRKLD